MIEKVAAIRQERRKVSELNPAVYNPRKRLMPGDEEYERLKNSIQTFGYCDPIIINADGTVIGGHQRLFVLRDLGFEEADVAVVDLSKADEKALNVALNKISGEWDEEKLAALFADLKADDYDLSLTGFSEDEYNNIIGALTESGGSDDIAKEEARESLAERFILPPTSILNARTGEWQDRRSAWVSIGINSEVGREENLTFSSAGIADPKFYDKKKEAEIELGRELSTKEFTEKYYKPEESNALSTSIFDPVLCEICYRWFSCDGAKVIDPFSGGSVRGIVAALTGREYTGIDLRPEQIAANVKQWTNICNHYTTATPPEWLTGDSMKVLPTIDKKYDIVFSCPPYADLEQYSDDPADLSNMEYDDFLKAYREIIRLACERLEDDRFAVFVVGEVRDKKGHYRNFVADTIEAFCDAGLKYYNEAILITPVSGARFRMGRMFTAGRKLCKMHQTVLVFVKGDWKKATEHCGDISADLPQEMDDI